MDFCSRDKSKTNDSNNNIDCWKNADTSNHKN